MEYLYLFIIFFKMGVIGFGGGYAILPLIYQDVQAFGIMSADDFSNLVALSQVTPGPIAVNAATYVGFKTAGILGACVATGAVVLPSFVLCLLLMKFLNEFKQNRVVQSILAGIKPATVGLMASAFLFLAQTSLIPGFEAEAALADNAHRVDVVAVIIFVVTLLLIRSKRLGAIAITLIGGALGVALSKLFLFFAN